MKIGNIDIEILAPVRAEGPLPLFLINDEPASHEKLFELCCEEKPLVLVSLSGFDWDKDLSPWPCPPVFRKTEGFAGKADDHLDLILKQILPALREELERRNIGIRYCAIAGYSLAGLFALYAGIRCDAFSKIASISGSLWYPDFVEYLQNNGISKNVDNVYLSLGDLEAKVRNPLTSTVRDKTEEIQVFLSAKTTAVFELNEGNHFKDPMLRTAKGIRYLLRDQ